MDADESSLLSRSVALQLAERLLLKMVTQNKMEAEAEVQLYLIVLEKQVGTAATERLVHARHRARATTSPNANATCEHSCIATVLVGAPYSPSKQEHDAG